RVEGGSQAESLRTAEDVAHAVAQSLLEEVRRDVDVVEAAQRFVADIFGPQFGDGAQVSDERAVARGADGDGNAGLQLGVADDARDVDARLLHALQAEIAVGIAAYFAE